MTDVTNDLDALLLDVRKTITENGLFLEKLLNETEGDEVDDGLPPSVSDEFEEL